MKILSRYILKEVLVYFTISLFIFTGILFTLRVLKLTSLIVNKGVLLSQVGIVFVSVIPAFLEIAVPLAALLGPMLTFARLSGDSEIIVIRASGISLAQLIRPILLFGLFAASIGFVVSHQLKPWGFRTLSTTLFEIARTKSTAGLEAGVFNDLGEITLYAESIDQRTGQLKGVLIEDRRKENQPRVIVARTGEIQSDPKQQTIIFDLHEGEIHEEEVDDKYVLTRYVTNKLIIDAQKFHGDDELRKNRRARELSWNELHEESASIEHMLNSPPLLEEELVKRHLEEGSLPGEEDSLTLEELKKDFRGKLRKLAFETHNRFSLPAAALLLALIGMPLGIQSPRSQKTWGAGLSALIGLIAFLLYFALFTVAKTFAEGGDIDPFIAAWLPNLITLLVAAYFLRQMSTERWQTISEGIERALLVLKRLCMPRRAVTAE
ncbi:MAG: LPS export ABC transporter permease LptF [Bdellovibrionales bacterium]|nr:LPS export ABC transporter permease LptF [Bdellovibrionales bacterium]